MSAWFELKKKRWLCFQSFSKFWETLTMFPEFFHFLVPKVFMKKKKPECYVFFQISRVLVGSQGLKRTKVKNEYAQRRRLRRINSLPKVKFSRLERLYQTQKLKLAFQKYKL